MKIGRIILIILMCCAKCFALEEGGKSPDISLPDSAGIQVSLESFKGNIVYLDFWASWCAPCKKSLPWMNVLNEKFRDKKFKILAVNLDTNREDAEKMLAEQKLNFKILFDPQGSSPEKFEVTAMPSSYLIDQNGNLLRIFRGFDEEHKQIIQDEIENSLKEIN